MSEELRPCPFCGAMPMGQDDRYMCSTLGCVMQEDTISAENWNTRPIEDALNARTAELSQAVGLITTLKPTMVMDTDHPLDMAKEVEVYVSARIAELEGFINRLIEAGDAMSNAQSMWVAEEDKWDALVKDWKESEE